MALAVWAVAQTTAAPRMDKVMPAILPPRIFPAIHWRSRVFRGGPINRRCLGPGCVECAGGLVDCKPDYKVIIEGHADERGTRDYNLALGARRAGSVREYLTLRGVSADRIQTVSYGKERPSELCSAESCYAMNRRGVTVLSNLSF